MQNTVTRYVYAEDYMSELFSLQMLIKEKKIDLQNYAQFVYELEKIAQKIRKNFNYQKERLLLKRYNRCIFAIQNVHYLLTNYHS